MRQSRGNRSPGYAPVRARERLSVGRRHVCQRGEGWEPGNVKVRARKRLSVERGDVHYLRAIRLHGLSQVRA